MVKSAFLAMTTDPAPDSSGLDLIRSDLRDMATAAGGLFVHAVSLADGVHSSGGVLTHILKFVAAFAAIYLLVLDRTNWKTNMLTALLIPYIFLTLPSVLFSLLRGEVGMWIAFVAVVLRLFFPKHFPDWLELPGSLILLLVVAPGLFADTIRGGLVGTFICLGIGCYLLQEHIRASGGFRNSFTKSNGISNSIGILLLFVYPVWALVLHFL